MSFLEHILNFLCFLILLFTAVVVAAIITAIVLNPKTDKEVTVKQTSADILEVTSDEPVELIKVAVKGKSLKPRPIEMINDRQPSIKSSVSEEVSPTYEETVLFRIITHEGGTDQTACYLVTQALYNACKKYNWQLSPLEMAYRYQYASPLEWHSKEAQKAYEDIFINGLVFSEIGNATVFYAPAYCSSSYHESQIFVYETHGIRFFEER